ncbi:transcription factor IIA, alpha/beta subunit-domain-containing protein [Entophlyctis helioformis]|nr:transcription factor IIA, alpha/beta subunit-domain-containing protein [Entophlyctis helioformis]
MSQKFAETGLDVNVLAELQQTWETKIAGAHVAPIVASSLLGSAGAGVPIAITQQPATSQMYLAANAPGFNNPGQYYPSSGNPLVKDDGGVYGYGSASGYQLPQHDGPADDDLDNGPAPTATAAATAHHPGLPVLSQQAIDSMSTREIDEMLLRALSTSATRRTRPSKRIAQLDGDNGDDDDEDDEDGATAAAGGSAATGGGTGESDIGSELDDDDEDEADVETNHLVLCQWEKVQRVKNKWKTILKDGVANINGKDYLFSKANCDFEW